MKESKGRESSSLFVSSGSGGVAAAAVAIHPSIHPLVSAAWARELELIGKKKESNAVKVEPPVDPPRVLVWINEIPSPQPACLPRRNVDDVDKNLFSVVV